MFRSIGRFNLESGFRIGSSSKRAKRLSELKPVLRQWAKLTNKYCARTRNDNPYWYNERANVSLLAGAAWRLGFVALEEYLTSKRPLDLKTAMNTRCRADLYVGGKSEFEIEAKQYWMHAHMKASTVKRRIKNYIDKALFAAKRNPAGTYRVGCVFFVIHFSQKRRYGNSDALAFKSAADHLLKQEIRRYIQENRDAADLWAWCFPTRTRMKRHKERDHFRYYPGIILALKLA